MSCRPAWPRLLPPLLPAFADVACYRPPCRTHTANIWSTTTHGGRPSPPLPAFNLHPKCVVQSHSFSVPLLCLFSRPLVLSFFCLHPFPPGSTMQSWESTMHPPVSQWPFRKRAIGQCTQAGERPGVVFRQNMDLKNRPLQIVTHPLYQTNALWICVFFSVHS